MSVPPASRRQPTRFELELEQRRKEREREAHTDAEDASRRAQQLAREAAEASFRTGPGPSAHYVMQQYRRTNLPTAERLASAPSPRDEPRGEVMRLSAPGGTPWGAVRDGASGYCILRDSLAAARAKQLVVDTSAGLAWERQLTRTDLEEGEEGEEDEDEKVRESSTAASVSPSAASHARGARRSRLRQRGEVTAMQRHAHITPPWMFVVSDHPNAEHLVDLPWLEQDLLRMAVDCDDDGGSRQGAVDDTSRAASTARPTGRRLRVSDFTFQYTYGHMPHAPPPPPPPAAANATPT